MEKYNRRKWLADTALLGSAVLLYPALGHGSRSVRDKEILALGANENPYGPSPGAVKAIEKHFHNANRYAFKNARVLAERLGEEHNLEASFILPGAGSSELLQLLGIWMVNNNIHLSYAFPAFRILPEFVKRFKGRFTETPLTVRYEHDLEALRRSSRKNPGAVYVVNPNNPTGTKLDKSELLSFCREVTGHSFVVVDEAYIEYAGEEGSVMELVRDNPRVIVLRTFSKIYGLAGLRIGYAVAHPQTLEKLRQLQVWAGSSLNLLGIEAALASLDDPGFVTDCRRKNRACLDFTSKELRKLGFQPADSHANFLYFELSGYRGDFREDMKKHNVLLSGLTVNGREQVRLSMGTKQEMKTFVEIARQLTAGKG